MNNIILIREQDYINYSNSFPIERKNDDTIYFLQHRSLPVSNSPVSDYPSGGQKVFESIGQREYRD